MTMHITHPEAPGHDAEATEAGWACVCGAGNRWEDGPRPRGRAVGGARRHLTAEARRNRPQEATESPETAAHDEAGTETPTPEENARNAGFVPENPPAPQRPAPVSLVDQFRSPRNPA